MSIVSYTYQILESTVNWLDQHPVAHWESIEERLQSMQLFPDETHTMDCFSSVQIDSFDQDLSSAYKGKYSKPPRSIWFDVCFQTGADLSGFPAIDIGYITMAFLRALVGDMLLSENDLQAISHIYLIGEIDHTQDELGEATRVEGADLDFARNMLKKLQHIVPFEIWFSKGRYGISEDRITISRDPYRV